MESGSQLIEDTLGGKVGNSVSCVMDFFLHDCRTSARRRLLYDYEAAMPKVALKHLI